MDVFACYHVLATRTSRHFRWPFLSIRCVCHVLELGLVLVLALIILTLPFSSISFKAALLHSTIQPSIFLFKKDVLMSLWSDLQVPHVDFCSVRST